ncbi:MAG TPA: energy transducer TonB, partial [Gammaproteobacteria bacterium]|nr:energy transducer TonB [Gammaproteobacteria bacterium]
RQVSGIVQVAYTVQPDGSATNIRVTGAAPKGYYEKQAKEIIASSYHRPTMGDDHRLHAREASTIIHFTVPAHQSAPDQASQP